MSTLIGELKMLAYSTVPKGWLPCDGSTYDIATYPDLFARIGARYGGNGTTTFSVPDFSDSVPRGGTAVASTGGASSLTLTEAQLPAHSHTVNADNTEDGAFAPSPSGAYLANAETIYLAAIGTPSTMNAGMIANTGSGEAIDITPAHVVVNFLIAYEAVP